MVRESAGRPRRGSAGDAVDRSDSSGSEGGAAMQHEGKGGASDDARKSGARKSGARKSGARKSSARKSGAQKSRPTSTPHETSDRLVEFALRSGPKGGQLLKVLSVGGVSELVAFSASGQLVWSLNLDEIHTLQVAEQGGSVTIKKGALFGPKSVLVFREAGDVEGFIELLVGLSERLSQAVRWGGEKSLKHALSNLGLGLGGEGEVRAAETHKGGQLLGGGGAGTLHVSEAKAGDDLAEDEDDEDEDEEDEEDEAVVALAPKSPLLRRELGARPLSLAPGELLAPVVEKRRLSMSASLRGSEWTHLAATRFNHLGQAEPCSVLASSQQQVVQIVSTVTGATLGAYRSAGCTGYRRFGVAEPGASHGAAHAGTGVSLFFEPRASVADQPFEEALSERATGSGSVRGTGRVGGSRPSSLRAGSGKAADDVKLARLNGRDTTDQLLDNILRHSARTGVSSSGGSAAGESVHSGGSGGHGSLSLLARARRSLAQGRARPALFGGGKKQAKPHAVMADYLLGSQGLGSMVTESLVFESAEQASQMVAWLQRHSERAALNVVLRRSPHPDECVKEMRGGWCVFAGFVDKKKKPRTVAINPMLGAVLVFKHGVVAGLVQPGAVPKTAFRISDPRTGYAVPMARGVVSMQFLGVRVVCDVDDSSAAPAGARGAKSGGDTLLLEALGVPSAGSFDPFRVGVLSDERDVWLYPVLSDAAMLQRAHQPQRRFKVTLDMRCDEEAARLLACVNSMRAVAEVAAAERAELRNARAQQQQQQQHQQQRKKASEASVFRRASLSRLPAQQQEQPQPSQQPSQQATDADSLASKKAAKLGSTAGLGAVPQVFTLSAAEMQEQAWGTPGLQWFSSQRRVFVGTFNVGDASPPKSAALEHWIPSPVGLAPGAGAGSAAANAPAKKFTSICGSGASGRYALYAIGLQEVSTKFDEWTKALSAHLGSEFTCAVSVRLWEIGLLVFIHADELQHVSNPVDGTKKTGVRIAKAVTGVQLGNKGGVGVGFRWRDVPVAFLCAHLSAHQNKVDKRNLHYREIMASIDLGGAPGHGTPGRLEALPLEPAAAFEHVFFLGDLNYRIDLPFEEAAKCVKERDFKKLGGADQLEAERVAGRAFFRFNTAAPEFTPTYRWKRGKAELSNKNDQPASYTDRVLWHSRPCLEDVIKLDSYGCAENLMISDHRPVAATFTFKVRHDYSWPYHPLTAVAGGAGLLLASPVAATATATATKESGKSPASASATLNQTTLARNQMRARRAGAGADQVWASPRGDFFISPREAAAPGAPEIRLTALRVELFRFEKGHAHFQETPGWLRLVVASNVFQGALRQSSFAPGMESVTSAPPPAMRKSMRESGSQVNHPPVSSAYCFDDRLGLPRLTPLIWDPLYLRSQHLVVVLEAPHSVKDQALMALLMDTMRDDAQQPDEAAAAADEATATAAAANEFAGQATIGLQPAVEAVATAVRASSISAWTRAHPILVPFFEPVVVGGVQIGCISGEIALLPHDAESLHESAAPNESAYEAGDAAAAIADADGEENQLRNHSLHSGWLQAQVVMDRANSPHSTSARAYAVLSKQGALLSLFSSSDKPLLDHLLGAFDLRDAQLKERAPSHAGAAIVLTACRRVGTKQTDQLVLGFKSEKRVKEWAHAIASAQAEAARNKHRGRESEYRAEAPRGSPFIEGWAFADALPPQPPR
jgi:hypothetical protein